MEETVHVGGDVHVPLDRPVARERAHRGIGLEELETGGHEDRASEKPPSDPAAEEVARPQRSGRDRASE